MKDLQEVISKHIEANWPMLCFLKPKATRVVFWFSHGRVFETSKTGPKFYIQAFDAQHPPEVWSGTSFDIFEIELGSFDNSSDESNAPLDMPWDAPMSQSNRALYEQMIQSAVVALKSGEMNKVVLSRTQDFSAKHLNWLDVLRRLFRVDQNAFRYLLVHPKFGLWAGASPEVLIKSKGDHFSTMALAGTRWIEQTELPKWTNKEYDEHNWVIREILHGLESAEKIQCSDTYDHKAAGVYHLRTDISGKLTHAESVLELAKNYIPHRRSVVFQKIQPSILFARTRGISENYIPDLSAYMITKLSMLNFMSICVVCIFLMINLPCLRAGASPANQILKKNGSKPKEK